MLSPLALTLLPALAFAAPTCVQDMEARWSALEGAVSSGARRPVELSRDGTVLRINGAIDGRTSSLFADISRQARAKIKTVYLDSPGGKIAQAAPIADWLRDYGVGVDVVVPAGAICASACTEILRCANLRYADPSALLLYHPASMPAQPGQSPLAKLLGDVAAAAVTAAQTAGPCSKVVNSRGDRLMDEQVLKGREVCQSASDLAQNYEGMILLRPWTAPPPEPPAPASPSGPGLLDGVSDKIKGVVTVRP